MDLKKYKKIGTSFIKDATNVTKDRYEKIKENYDYEKSIRERKEKLAALDEELNQKYKEIQLENDFLEMIKGRVEQYKQIEHGENPYSGKTTNETEKYYYTLHCKPTDSFEVIKNNYQRLSLRLHPDKLPPNADENTKKFANEKFAELKDAFDKIQAERSR